MQVLWSAKGGSGTTVIAASLASLISRSSSVLLIDAAGDVPSALGVAEPSGPGIRDWLTSSMADAASLRRLALPAAEQLDVIARGSASHVAHDAWARLGDAATELERDGVRIVVDLGMHAPPEAMLRSDDASLLVVRPCYLALRRAVSSGLMPTGIVLVDEPGRALRRNDVARSIGAPVVAEVPFDPALARLVDAGLLAARLPTSVTHALAPLT